MAKEPIKPSNRARRFHKFASQYKWDYETFLRTPYWLLNELEAILDEGANSLNKYIDFDEIKMMKTLLRSRGVTEEDSEE